MNKHTNVVIMAGGIGSRFWPGSRESRPKQFLDIMGVGKSLIRLTFERFLNLCPADRIYIVTNRRYKALVQEHLPELPEANILCEPTMNNTAPCVAYAAYKIKGIDPDANFVVAPSDHIVLKEATFVEKLNAALDFAGKNDALLTLGITPSRPDTGYGYIQFEEGAGEVKRVMKFTEKPPLEKAKSFVASGDYLWNAGIFIWSVSSLCSAFERYQPEIHEKFTAAAPYLNTENEQAYIDEMYPTTPKISIDYAIMEKADNVYTIPSEFGWSDLGTWNSLHAESDKDKDGNVCHSSHAMILETKNSLIRAPKGKLVVVRGLEDYIVVDEEDVLLIYPKSKEQEIKPLRGEIVAQFGKEFT